MILSATETEIDIYQNTKDLQESTQYNLSEFNNISHIHHILIGRWQLDFEHHLDNKTLDIS